MASKFSRYILLFIISSAAVEILSTPLISTLLKEASPQMVHTGTTPLKAVLFDLAGTTFDYGSRAPITAFLTLFKSAGLPITEAEVRVPMGAEKREHIRQLLAMQPIQDRWIEKFKLSPNEHDIEVLYKKFVPIQIESIKEVSKPISGFTQTLTYLERLGLKIGCNTGYSRAMADAFNSHFDSIKFFPDSFVCGDEVANGRPAPDMLLKNAKELGLVNAVAQCITVDDTPVGVEAGVKAGMWSVGVLNTGNEVGLSEEKWNNLTTEDQTALENKAYKSLNEAGAHFLIGSIGMLPRIIPRINLLLANGHRP